MKPHKNYTVEELLSSVLGCQLSPELQRKLLPRLERCVKKDFITTQKAIPLKEQRGETLKSVYPSHYVFAATQSCQKYLETYHRRIHTTTNS